MLWVRYCKPEQIHVEFSHDLKNRSAAWTDFFKNRHYTGAISQEKNLPSQPANPQRWKSADGINKSVGEKLPFCLQAAQGTRNISFLDLLATLVVDWWATSHWLYCLRVTQRCIRYKGITCLVDTHKEGAQVETIWFLLFILLILDLKVEKEEEDENLICIYMITFV